MNSMICREYLENFSFIYLNGKLYSWNYQLFILSVDSFSLIMNI